MSDAYLSPDFMDVPAGTMIERMAKAMWESGGHSEPWGGSYCVAETYRDMARAVLTALMEPSEAVLKSGFLAASGPLGPAVHSVWQAMLTAILEGK